MEPKLRGNPVFWLFLTVVLFGAWWLVHSLGRGRQIVKALLHIPAVDLLAICAVSVCYFVVQGTVLALSYRILKIDRNRLYGILMFLSSNFVNTVAPVVGLSGSAYIVFIENKQGISKPRAILLTIIFYLIDYGAFLVLLLIAATYLAVTSSLPRPILVGTVVFSGLIALLAAATITLLTHPAWLQAVLSRIKRIGKERADEFAGQTTHAYEEARHSPKLIAQTFAFAFLNHFLAMGILAIALHASGVVPSVPLLLAGYSIGTLLAVVSITPAGLGVAEGGMVAAFTGLGVPVETAVLASLLFRFGIVIIPLLLGLPALHRIQEQASSSSPQSV